jgi:hypothetical protein
MRRPAPAASRAWEIAERIHQAAGDRRRRDWALKHLLATHSVDFPSNPLPNHTRKPISPVSFRDRAMTPGDLTVPRRAFPEHPDTQTIPADRAG